MPNGIKRTTMKGMLKDIRTIVTKKGAPMAFAKLEDFDGAIDLTFFPKIWEKLQSQLHNDDIIAVTGKIDTSRDPASFLVDDIKNPDTLQTHSIQEIHVKINPSAYNEREMMKFRDFIFGASGNCSLYLHMDTMNKCYTVKAGSSMTVSADEDFLSELKEQPEVMEIWTM